MYMYIRYIRTCICPYMNIIPNQLSHFLIQRNHYMQYMLLHDYNHVPSRQHNYHYQGYI